MAEVKLFRLPDLGEGLPDAEIVEWHKQVGEHVALDENLVSMETAKAVVEVPSPYSGRLVKVYGQARDVIETGKPLCEIELDAGPQRAEAHDTGHHGSGASSAEPSADSGTVVGAMQSSNEVVHSAAVSIGGVRAMPAVRAMATKLGIDLRQVRASGPDGSVSMEDLKRHAARPDAPPPSLRSASPEASAGAPVVPAGGQVEALRGLRRNMARAMAEAHAQVVPTTLCDDADISAWQGAQDITLRLVQALVAASTAVPALNAHFDGQNATRTLHARVDVGLAIDTEEGLLVAALRHCERRAGAELRAEIDQLRRGALARELPPEALRDYTLMLSNFGMYAGRYATPVVTPPCVAILAAGRARWQSLPVMGGFEARRMLPLSLTFDHRACTGGEAARFLAVLLKDLARAA